MIIFILEAICILVLIGILVTLVIEEQKKRRRKMQPVKLKGYWHENDRRNVERLNISLDVRYAINGEINKVKSLDVSTEGVRLLLTDRLEKGTPLSLEVKLPDYKNTVKLNGEVIWAEESIADEKKTNKRLFATGIKFSKFHDPDEKKLFTYLYHLDD